MGRLLTIAASAAVLVLASSASAGAQSKVPPVAGSPTASVSPVAPESPGSIDGRVIDERGASVSGALVSALGATMAVVETDGQGRFTFTSLQPDSYVVRAHVPGQASSRRAVVRVKANERSTSSLQLQRSIPMLAGVGTGGDLVPVMLATGLIGTEAEAAEVPLDDPSPSETSTNPADDHSETAWRLRHLRRSVLKETTDRADGGLGELPDAFQPSAMGWWFGRAAQTTSRVADLFADVPWSGEVNLLTTTSFQTPRDLFSGEGLPRGIAYISIGAPTGDQGKWAVQGAMTQGDVSSWLVAGTYTNRIRGAHAFDLGMSYSTQRYDGGNAVALAAVSDGSRNVGAIFGRDRWTLPGRTVIDYGVHYARYDYLVGAGLFSPDLGVTFSLTDRTRIRGSVSQRMVAPGAEEFLPPTFSGMWLPPERTFSPAIASDAFRPERARQREVAFEHDFSDSYGIGVRRFYERADDQLVTLFGIHMPGTPATDLGHYFVANAGSFDSAGWGVTLTCRLADRVKGSIDYAITNAQWSPSHEATLIALVAPSAVRRGSEQFYDVTTSIEADIPETSTRLYVFYKINSGFTGPDAGITSPALDGRFDIRIHQALPFMTFTNVQWEFLLAVRNLFRASMPDGSAYDELLVVRPPKRIVGGLQVKF